MAVVSLVLALAAPARAEMPARRASKAAPAPAAQTAPATPLAATAPFATAPAPGAETIPPAVASRETGLRPGFDGALLLGPEFVNDATALKLRVDLERELLPLAPRVVLSTVLSAGVMHWSHDTTVTLVGVTTTTTASLDRFELVPSLRARLALTPRLSLHGDAGLGATFALTSAKTTSSLATVPALKATDQYAGMVLRFAVGGAFDLSERLRIGAELLGLNFHYGEGHGQSVTVLASASYRL